VNAPSLPLDLYVRVSRRGKREAEAFGSPQDQLRDARHFAEAHGLPIGIELPHDIDQSGGKTERPGFQEALRRIKVGESGGIIVAYQSRYSRDVLSGLQALEEIDKAGGAVYGPNIADYSTPDGKMLFTINLAIDAGYLDRKAAEFDRSKRQAIERGIPVSTRAPVGYRKVSKDDPRQDMRRRYEADPAMAPVVREAFVLRAAGKGPAEIGRFLAEHGVTTSQGGQWSKQAVYGLLANPVYKGWLSWGPYENRNAHEAIVDDALWLAAQHARPQRERPVPTSQKHA